MNPDDASNGDERHRRQNHKAVVHIAEVVERLRNHLESENGARAEEFAEETHYHENNGIANAVADAVEECRPGLVAEGKCLEASHKDTVGDNKSDKH